ncbi:hypothetical protein CBL_14600 [Carabus blaptoides fortunei]
MWAVPQTKVLCEARQNVTATHAACARNDRVRDAEVYDSCPRETEHRVREAPRPKEHPYVRQSIMMIKWQCLMFVSEFMNVLVTPVKSPVPSSVGAWNLTGVDDALKYTEMHTQALARQGVTGPLRGAAALTASPCEGKTTTLGPRINTTRSTRDSPNNEQKSDCSFPRRDMSIPEAHTARGEDEKDSLAYEGALLPEVLEQNQHLERIYLWRVNAAGFRSADAEPF